MPRWRFRVEVSKFGYPVNAIAIFDLTFQICATCCGLSLDKFLQNFTCVRNLVVDRPPVQQRVIAVMKNWLQEGTATEPRSWEKTVLVWYINSQLPEMDTCWHQLRESNRDSVSRAGCDFPQQRCYLKCCKCCVDIWNLVCDIITRSAIPETHIHNSWLHKLIDRLE